LLHKFHRERRSSYNLLKYWLTLKTIQRYDTQRKFDICCGKCAVENYNEENQLRSSQIRFLGGSEEVRSGRCEEFEGSF